MEIDQFVLDAVFTHLPATDDRDEAWYASTNTRDGWVIIWPNGECLHTYRDPGEWY